MAGFIRKTGRGFVKWFFNAPAWIGKDQLQQGGRIMRGAFSQVFGHAFEQPSDAPTETADFDAVCAHNGLDGNDIAAQARRHLRYAMVFVLLGFGILGYAGYSFWVRDFLNGCVCFFFAALMGVSAIRHHFFYTMLVRKRLGLRLADWWRIVWGEPRT